MAGKQDSERSAPVRAARDRPVDPSRYVRALILLMFIAIGLGFGDRVAGTRDQASIATTGTPSWAALPVGPRRPRRSSVSLAAMGSMANRGLRAEGGDEKDRLGDRRVARPAKQRSAAAAARHDPAL